MRRRLAVLVALLLGLSLVGSAQAAAGPVASRIEGLFWAITAFAFAVSFVVYGVLIWFLWRYRRSVSPTGAHIEGDRKLETIWTIVPTIIVVVITLISAPVLIYTDTPPPADYAVRVTAERFSWNFDYFENPNADMMVTARDLTTSGELWIQAGTVVRLVVTSRDVIHSFAVAELAVKIDAIPGHDNHWWLQADEPGEYLTQCAEFCGEGHYGMRATIHVFSAEQRQQEAAAAGMPAKPYGPPPKPIEITDIRMQNTGNVTPPFYRIVPETGLAYPLGANVVWRVWNDASQPFDFRIDVAVNGTNNTGTIPPFENRTIAFTLNTPSATNVSYGPTDSAARANGMLGNFTIRAGKLVGIIFRETGCPAPKVFCLVTDPPQDPLRIEKGEPVVFELRNEGTSMHNFRMDYPEFEVFYEAHIAGGESVFFGPFTFSEDYTGKYWCDVAGHRGLGMEGDFVVGAGSVQAAAVPIFPMMVITVAIGVPATFAYIFHHARRPDDEAGS